LKTGGKTERKLRRVWFKNEGAGKGLWGFLRRGAARGGQGTREEVEREGEGVRARGLVAVLERSGNRRKEGSNSERRPKRVLERLWIISTKRGKGGATKGE